MLEKLDTISWYKLSHAYGSAADVPQLLRDIVSPSKRTRNAAYDTLHSNIYHQGTVYEASAAVVPFLIELLKDKQAPERDRIVELLEDLIIGYVFWRRKRRQQNSLEQQVYEEEIYWAVKTYQAVHEGINTYLLFLRHRQRCLKMQAINLLGHFEENKVDLVLLLSERLLRETNEYIRASLIFSLGRLIEYNSAQYALLTRLLTKGETGLIKITAAMALVNMGNDNTPPQAVETLIRAVKEHETWDNAFAGLPWCDFRFALEVLRVLRSLPPSMNMFAVPRLLQSLTFFDEKTSEDDLKFSIMEYIAESMLFLAFREESQEGNDFEDLTSEQQQVLQAIVATDALWLPHAGVCSLPHEELDEEKRPYNALLFFCFYPLLKLGMPDQRKEFREYVHQEAGPYDEIPVYLSAKNNSQIIRKLNPHLSEKGLRIVEKVFVG